MPRKLLGERRGTTCKGGCRASALNCAQDIERVDVWSEVEGERCDRKYGYPADENLFASVHIGKSTRCKHEASEGEHETVGDPVQLGGVCLEFDPDSVGGDRRAREA